MARWQVFVVLLALVAAEVSSKKVTITCPAGYEIVGGNCYFVSADLHTGSSAQDYCRNNGGHAAIIESREEMDMLKETVLKTTTYLGVNIQEYRNYKFQFVLKMGGHAGFTDFGTGEPDNYGSEDCVVADITDGLKWKDIHCTELHPVLCKAPGIVNEEPSCGEGAYLFDENTCFWASSSKYTWLEAEDECNRRGWHLASVHSELDNSLIFGLSRGESAWIGLNAIATDGSFVWNDGTPLDYENWVSAEPDDGDKGWECVYMNFLHSGMAGEWLDNPCDSGARRAVCKGPPS